MLGNDVRRGLLPSDRSLLDAMVADICFFNAKNYFGFGLPRQPADRGEA
jgi:glucuronate isomerase